MGRPKKITFDIRSDIIYMYKHGLSLKAIANYIFCSHHITISRTAVKYTIDEYKSFKLKQLHIKMVTPENSNIHQIIMVNSSKPLEDYRLYNKNKQDINTGIDHEE